MEKVIEELARQNAEQRELLDMMAESMFYTLKYEHMNLKPSIQAGEMTQSEIATKS